MYFYLGKCLPVGQYSSFIPNDIKGGTVVLVLSHSYKQEKNPVICCIYIYIYISPLFVFSKIRNDTQLNNDLLVP